MSVDKSEPIDPKETFKAVMKKKRNSSGVHNINKIGGSKIRGGQTAGSFPKMFRRKSGSA